MQIERGLFEHMVLQCTAKDVCDVRIQGHCDGAGPVHITVRSSGRVLKGFRSVAAGRAAKGRFEARLKGLAVGGPYDIELLIGQESLSVGDVLVGDVWLLGGQSNMEGFGRMKFALPAHPLTRVFHMDDHWGVAKDPLHDLWHTAGEIHPRLLKLRRSPPPPTSGVGPGVPFAQEMLRRTGVPQGLIACSHGGSTMAQWDPALKNLGGGSLYGATIRRIVANGSRVAGLLWWQGESDADKDASAVYTARMVQLVRALRRDSGDPALPVGVVQLGRLAGMGDADAMWWNSIQDQQRRLAETLPRVAVVPAVDMALDDDVHVSGKSFQPLGVRLADAMLAFRRGRPERLPIALKSIVVKEPVRGAAEVHVTFANVSGKLTASNRAYGFSLRAPLPVAGVYDVDLAGPVAIVRTWHSAATLKGMSLSYGAGGDPACNIVDEANRSLPVFGPIPLGKPMALTAFARRLRVSKARPWDGSLGKLKRPDLARLRMSERLFPADFCDIHADLATRGPADGIVYLACAFQCPEAMKLELKIGYDGPVKVWVDQRAIFQDPKGTNPALPTDKGKAAFAAAKGQHELIVALASNHGSAYGVYLRLERLDVPRRVAMIWPLRCPMPELLG